MHASWKQNVRMLLLNSKAGIVIGVLVLEKWGERSTVLQEIGVFCNTLVHLRTVLHKCISKIYWLDLL